MADNGDLTGKVIMITGAARSLGAATADYLERRGATVLRSDLEAADGVAELDVRSSASWAAAITEALGAHHRIDGLVNNAAIYFGMRGFWDETEEQFDQLLATNIKGSWLGTQLVSKAMAEAGTEGSIVNLSSTSGVMATRGFAGYGTTRWAVRGLTKWAAAELAGYRIRVNSVHPHSMAGTGMMSAISASLNLGADDIARLAASNPLGRMGTMDDVAAAIDFLISAKSSFITGREFVIDGGASLGGAS